MSYLCRCSNRVNCHLRRALRKRPQDYVRPPKCEGCGRRKYYIDRWQERSNAARFCRCGGYWFTHRRGSKWCLFATSPLSLQELSQHYGGTPIEYLSHPRYHGGKVAEEIPF